MIPSENKSESPCIRNCCLNAEDICLGCYRTLDEILKWHETSIESRKEIMKRANIRQKQQAENSRLVFANRHARKT